MDNSVTLRCQDPVAAKQSKLSPLFPLCLTVDAKPNISSLVRLSKRHSFMSCGLFGCNFARLIRDSMLFLERKKHYFPGKPSKQDVHIEFFF